ncbi:right-handed parallel beta-helix repeat-containing protein [Cellulomonas sp. SG140]|uniref:right-handed parallel beta-helix repeat-containing protein n=1 Tax=Cellulomonas sp. SG140 TaxID=2976536 RepID=UPI0021E81C0B|nr:right-handed parallel beta-helix repeat-containing protein [Cellulomonas sp. SG140]
MLDRTTSPRRRRTAVAVTATALLTLTAAAPAVADASLGQQAGSGTTYWVSPDGPDQGADGLTESTAFRTIQACADQAQPGDTCLIGSGTYDETVTPPRSGTAEASITFSAAPGAHVVVSGAQRLTGFTPVGDKQLATIVAADPYAANTLFSAAVAAHKIYSVPADLGSAPAEVQVFTDSRMDIEASYPFPGTDLLDPAIERAGAGSAGSTIVDPALTRPAGYWDGARVLTSYWYITTTGTVASSAPGSVTLTTAPVCVHKVVPTDTWYRLSGKIGELGYPGSYFYDAAAHRLYLYSDDNPNRHRIETKVRDLAFDLTAVSDVRVQDVGLFASTIRTGSTSTGVTLDGIDGRYLSHYWDVTQGTTNCGQNVTRGVATSGIVLEGTGNTIENSDLQFSAGNGVSLGGYANTARNNVITDVDYAGTYAAGVAVRGHSQTVEHNTIARVGRSGINLQWNGVTGTTPAADHLSYNDISGYATLSVDTAAIYTCCSSRMAGTQIDHNALHDPTPRPGGVYPFGISGIYADNGQSDLRITDNVGWGNHEGTVELNGLGSGSHDNLVANNTGGMTLFYVRGPNQSTGTQILNNIGPIAGLDRATEGGLVLSNNLISGDPLFVDAAAHDYRLQAGSPARQAAIPIPGVNDGSTDPLPSLGAFQYGAPAWTAGARS